MDNFAYDVKIMAYRTSNGGRTAIILLADTTMDDAVTALNVSEFAEIGLGQSRFEEFSDKTDAMLEALVGDGTFDFDPATDTDESGNPDETLLNQVYAQLANGMESLCIFRAMGATPGFSK